MPLLNVFPHAQAGEGGAGRPEHRRVQGEEGENLESYIHSSDDHDL